MESVSTFLHWIVGVCKTGIAAQVYVISSLLQKGKTFKKEIRKKKKEKVIQKYSLKET